MVCEFLNKVAGSLETFDLPQEYRHGRSSEIETIAAWNKWKVQNSSLDLYDPYANNDIAFFPACIETLSVTLVTELGDNTFFTAAILAMKHPRIIVFVGALTALTVMNALSVSLSMVLSIIPKVYTYYFSTGMLVFFGTRMLKEAYCMSPTEPNGFDAMQEDMEERKKNKGVTGCGGGERNLKRMDILMTVFTTVLLAEFGDRSQLTTFVLSARKNALGVIVGGTIGRTISTASAVIGGRMIAERISVRTVSAVGGMLFLLFAFSSTMSNDSNLSTVSV